MAPSKTASAAAVLGPEVVAPLAAEEAAKRFWGGLVQALGKDCYETVTVKVGRKTVLKSRRVFGQERTVDLSGPAKVVTIRHAVARWEVLPLFVLGAAAAAYAASETTRGAAALGKGQAWYSAHGPLAQYHKAWNATVGKKIGQTNANQGNFWAGFAHGITNPFGAL